MEIKAFDLAEAWWNCLTHCWNEGKVSIVDKGSFEGNYRKELSPVTIEVSHPGVGNLIPIVPEYSNVPPPTTIEQVEQYLSILADPTPPSARADYHYGEWLASQIPVVISFYKKWHEETGGYGTNRLCMRTGDQNTIQAYIHNDAHTPCLSLVDTKIINGQLDFFVDFRSWDLWGGFPVNLGGLQLLKEVMAEEIGVEDGRMIAFSKGLHLYDHVWSWVEELVS